MRVILLILSFVFSILLAVLPGQAQSRVALVVGNSAYRSVSPLPNTQNDATDVAAALQRLGFSVKTLHNGTFDDMRRALLQFGRDARGADMAVVYFAGHGMEISGENWLIPIDAELRSDRDAESEAISLKSAMLQVANATSLGLVILDSCRDNPFAAQMQRVSRPRAVDRGLARVEPTDNVLVAYAAKDGTVASDGRDRNSPFTAALLKNLETPGVEIRFLLATVRDEVLATTNRQQQPFVYGSLSRQAIYLKPPVQSQSVIAASPPGLQQPLTEAERAWAVVQANPSIAAMEAFVRRFGDSFYADLARVRIEELKKLQAAAALVQNAVPPSPTSPSPVAPKSASPRASSGPCGVRRVVLLDPCLPGQEAAPPQPAGPAATTRPAENAASTLQERLLSRMAEYSVLATEREGQARGYETDAGHRAIALSVENHRTYRTTRWATAAEAETGALEGCQVAFGKACALIATDDQVQPTGPPVLRDMPRPHYSGTFDLTQVPKARPELFQRADIANYKSAPEPKAAAYHHRFDLQGALFVVIGGGGQFEAEELALNQCNNNPIVKSQGRPCFLYAVGNQVVLPQRSIKPLSPRRTDPLPSQPRANSSPSLHDQLLARFAELSVAADEAESRARDYEADKDHKAIAVGLKAHRTWRQSQWGTDDAAVTATLEKCQAHYGEPCTLVAVGDKVEPASGGSPVLRDMPRTRYDGLFEPEQIPGANGDLKRRTDVVSYRSAAGPKAAAYHPWGRLFIVRGSSQFEAGELALKQCNDDPDRKGRDGPCFLYAVGDQVVLPQRSVKLLSQGPTDPQQRQPVATKPQASNSPSLHDRLLARFAALSIAAGEAEARARDYEAGREPKAIAAAIKAHHTWRATGRSSEEAAISSTLEGCQVHYGEPCTLVAVGDKVEPAPVRDMPRTQYSGRFEPERVPSADGSLLRRADVTAYRSVSGPKAAAYHPWGLGWLFIVTGAPGQSEAEEQVLAQCNDDPRRKAERQEGPCFLYAVGDRVVLPQRLAKPRPKAQTISEALDYLGVPRYSYAYLNEKGHKAIAAAPESRGTYRWSGATSVAAAEERALEGCQLEYRTNCVVLASDDALQAPDLWKAERHDMPRLNYKGAYAPDSVPLFSGTEDALRSYASLPAPKAMVIRPNGARVRTATGASLVEAQSKALATCNDDLGSLPCFVYAVNERVILDQRRTEPLK